MTAGRENVAVIEDTPDTAETFRLFLNQLCDDFDVCSFHDGPAFLKTAAARFLFRDHPGYIAARDGWV
jgi:hypothetical protein